MNSTWEYPVEQLVRRRNQRYQYRFALTARAMLPPKEDFYAHVSGDGLALHAKSEDALEWPVSLLRDMYGERIELGAPRVRLWRGDHVHEPVMQVRIATPRVLLEPVVEELARRGVEVQERYVAKNNAVVRTEAPLARLLGLPVRLRELTEGRAEHWFVLSHYAKPDPGPDGGLAA
jgi:hypothetical protein